MTATVDDFTHSEYAQERRKEKARALGRWLWINGYTDDAARSVTGSDWRAAARNAGVNPPGPETVDMALQWLAWLWRTEGAPPQPPRPAEPAPVAVTAEAPTRPAVVKGSCHWPGCGEAGRLYPEGWRCDQHSPWTRRGVPFQDDLKAQADAALAANQGTLPA